MINTLEKHPLFAGISKDNIKILLDCLVLHRKTYKKNEYIIQEGNKVPYVGILIYGRVYMEKEDASGNIYLITEIPKNFLFGEIFICPQPLYSTVNYRAVTDSTILFIKYESILHLSSHDCSCHQRLIENLVNLIALKSRAFIEKIEIISKNTIRERVLAYLSLLSVNQSSDRITSPFNHKEMASYLCVNRSSLIRELHRMKDENLIDYEKNKYVLKNTLEK